jgi:putative DNA primase/helicase
MFSQLSHSALLVDPRLLTSTSLTSQGLISARPCRLLAERALRDAGRSLTALPRAERLTAFGRLATTLADQVREGHLELQVVADRLLNAATAYGIVADHGTCAVQHQLNLAFRAAGSNMHAKGVDAATGAEISVLPTHAGATSCDVIVPAETVRPSKRRLISHRASDIKPERLTWIWNGRIACGKVMLIGGPPGLGKSQVTVNLAATVSVGGAWPCHEGIAPEGDIIFLSAEDGIADTIVPRLMAAGANLERIHIVAAATKPDGTGRKTFSLKTDVDLLERLVAEIGTVRLIIIDPISAYMGGADGNGNVETREVLEPLAEMANRLGIAVVAVTHLNKGTAGGQTALNRFAGSIAFVAAARSAYLIVDDPEDEHRRLFLEAKNNLGPKSRGLAFRVQQRVIGEDIPASNITWDTDHVTASVHEALSASENPRARGGRTGKDDAADFLRAVLAAGGMPVLEIEREARRAGLLGAESSISQEKAFRSARLSLGVTSQRTGGTAASGNWVWELPPPPKMPPAA